MASGADSLRLAEPHRTRAVRAIGRPFTLAEERVLAAVPLFASLRSEIAGIIGALASADLLIEKIEMLKNPTYVPSCSINPVLACGSVINTPQASVFMTSCATS